MVIPPLGNPYSWYTNPYYWVDNHPYHRKAMEFRLTCVHKRLDLGTLQRNSTEWRFGCGSPVLVVTATGWGKHPKIRAILSLRSWMNNVTLGSFCQVSKMATEEQIPNTRIFRSFLGTDFPPERQKKQSSTYEDGPWRRRSRLTHWLSLTFRLGVLSNWARETKLPNMTWTNFFCLVHRKSLQRLIMIRI